MNKPLFTQAWIIGGLVLSAALMTELASQPPSDKIVFLDIGQGDSILIQNGLQQMLVDGGPGAGVLSQLANEMPSFDTTVDVLVLTHPQQDHLEGFLHVINKYDVGLVVLPWAAAESQLYRSFLDLLEERAIPYRFAWAGQVIQFADAKMQVLAPIDSEKSRTITRADVNNASTTLRIDFHGLSVLLTGDAEQVAEQLLIASTQQDLLNVDVLKAGHHGSNSSTHVPLLRAASPMAAVISVGADNRFGHPHPNVLKRLEGIPVWRTDTQGAVRFLYNGQTWHQTCFSC